MWAAAMLADAVLLKGVDSSVFVAALLVLILGAAGTDALIVRALPREHDDGRALQDDGT